MKLKLLGAGALALGLAACGGGGGGHSGPPGIVTPPTTTPVSGARAIATLAFLVPRASESMATFGRVPQFISPGTDKIAFMLDKHEVIFDALVAHYVDAGPSGNGTFTDAATGTTITLSATAASPAYFAVTLTIDTTPGSHEFGIVLKSGTPAYVLSEGQNTYNLPPTAANGTPTNLGNLALNGAMGTGYIECPNPADNGATNPATAPSTTCSNYSNFTAATPPATGGTYQFVATVADYDGFPIVYQTVSATPVTFDNGSYSVVESDATPIVTITQPGAPWTNPGNALTGPSGGFVPGIGFIYGNPFSVACTHTGVANLALKFTTGTGGHPTTAIDGYNYTNINGYAPSSQTDGSVLPLGSKTSVVSPRQPINNVQVQCNANGTLTVI